MTAIEGKTCFITGAANGIGLAMATSMASRGARLILSDIDEARLAAAAGRLESQGAEVATVAFNVAEEGEWDKARKIADAFGAVDILCSNAGVGGGSGALEVYDTDVWRWNYAVNVHAHLYACRTFLGGMKERGGGHLLITGSMVGITPPPVSVAYISSKFAAVGIAMALRNELADSDVAISLLLPGMSATNNVVTTRTLRPGGSETGQAAETSRAMESVLATGMSPDAIGERAVQAISEDEFFIFTHPEWKPLVEAQAEEMLAAFGVSADPAYAGDDIEALLAANGARAFGAGAKAAGKTS